MIRRANPVVRRIADDRFELVLSPENRQGMLSLLGELDDLLESAPDDPSLRRLHPTAYHDDAERDAAYQLLAGEELRASRRATIDAVQTSLAKAELTRDELWSWLRALNALRLVVGTRLDITDDDHSRPRRRRDDPDGPLWSAYEFATQVQYFVISALGD